MTEHYFVFCASGSHLFALFVCLVGQFARYGDHLPLESVKQKMDLLFLLLVQKISQLKLLCSIFHGERFSNTPRLGLFLTEEYTRKYCYYITPKY